MYKPSCNLLGIRRRSVFFLPSNPLDPKYRAFVPSRSYFPQNPQRRRLQKKRASNETLNEIRRRPTLPGRFQPSTISVLRLNFCVRDGNRWVPQAIVTGKERGSRLLLPRGTWYVPSLLLPPSWYRQSAVTHGLLTSLFGFRLQLLGFAPSKPHRLEFPFRLTMASGPLLHTLRFLIFNQFIRSSPRPISIIKLHVLPHFHR